MEEVKELVEKMTNLTASFLLDANKSANGNKLAGQRARVASVELTKLMKAFRHASVKAQ